MARLQEKTRNELISKSKTGDKYAPNNQYLGKNRHERRLHQKPMKSVSQLNQLNMNKIFKDDIFDINIKVRGETDEYIVRISFSGFLDNLHRELQHSEFNQRTILRALTKAFNGENVFVRCSCPDFRYRQAYWASKNSLIAGDPETRPSDITNPKDTKGGVCKHIAHILSNNSWLMGVASVIYNYCNYMKTHKEDLYAKIIYPAIFEKPYEDEYQLSFDEPELTTGEDDTIDISNKEARERGRFKPGNEYRIKPTDDIVGQKTFNFDSEISD